MQKIILYTLIVLTLIVTIEAEEKKMNWKELTNEERNIILHKGTEQPFTGKYNKHYESGIYACKQCGQPLYRSDAKFNSACGWPSFDDEISGSVTRKQDADGQRVEIICSNCKGHLGHVFTGEKFTEKDTRHCVNSISLKFIPAENLERAYFAGGCFWGVEYYFEKKPGVLAVTSGYSGGDFENPTYEQVSRGATGDAETVEVIYDKTKIEFETLAKLFFEIHDFTQLNRQGPDIGMQYRSEIFYVNDKQKEIAEHLINTLQNMNYDVKTKISELKNFYDAEAYHQNYYERKKSTPYCHAYTKIF